MSAKVLKTLQSCLLCSCLVALLSCGKKASEKSAPEALPPQPIEDDFDAYLDKQTVTCSETSTCPTYIAKVVVRMAPGKYKTCTGFLTDSNTIATSTTCVPQNIRLKDGDCSKDIAFFFYERFSKGLRVGCKSVQQANEDYQEDPLLNREDLAFLNLDTSLNYRRILRISREGMGTNKYTRIIGVEQSDETNGEIKELDCPSIVNSYVNPLVTTDSSPGFTLAGCAFSEGFSGAPVIDYRNKTRVIGVVSAGMDPDIRAYLKKTGLLVNGLKDFILGTNLACAPTVYDNNVADEKECSKELSKFQIEKLRSSMLSTTTLFSDFRSRLENALESATRYVRFNMKLVPRVQNGKPNYDIQDVEITPKCFKNVSLMSTGKYQNISGFKIPSRTFRKVMDEWGRILGNEIENAAFVTNISWNPKDLRKYKVTPLYYWDEETGNTTQTFTDFPICQ